MTTGAWIKGDDLANAKRAKIVSETSPQPSKFLNDDGSPKIQDVCKARFEGLDDVYNLSLNKTTINGLLEAFGDDSKDWMNHYLRVETEKVRIGGKTNIAIYLIPEGYEKVDNADGFAEIRKIGLEKAVKQPDDDIPVVEDEVDIKDIPF